MRLLAPPGELRVASDSIVADSGRPDPVDLAAQEHAVANLPHDALVYLLGSRYCETSPQGSSLIAYVSWRPKTNRGLYLADYLKLPSLDQLRGFENLFRRCLHTRIEISVISSTHTP